MLRGCQGLYIVGGAVEFQQWHADLSDPRLKEFHCETSILLVPHKMFSHEGNLAGLLVADE